MSENWHPPKVYNSEETGPNILNTSVENVYNDATAYEKKSNFEDSFLEIDSSEEVTSNDLTEKLEEKQIFVLKSTDTIISSKKDASKFENVPTDNDSSENDENIPPINENSPQKASNRRKLPKMTQKTKSHILKKEQFDQNSDILSAALSESQIDMEDFSTFENIPSNDRGTISKTLETTTDPNLQLTPGRDISETRREYNLPYGM